MKSPSSSLYTHFAAGVLFPLHEWAKKHTTIATLRRLEESQWWSPDQLHEYRIKRLRDFLIEIGQNVPYYRRVFSEQGFDPSSVTDLEVLQRLPTCDKNAIRQKQADWFGDPASDLQEFHTSGSTGEPLRFFLSNARISHDVAAKWRATRWWGVDIGDPETVLWGSAIETAAQGFVKSMRDCMLRTQLIPVAHLTNKDMSNILDQLIKSRPRMIFGYPSILSRLALHAKQQGRDMSKIGVKVVFVTSEILQPRWREIISEVFCCGIANEYGARDAGFIARECPEGNLHISAEDIIVETVDDAGLSVEKGQKGEVIVTHLCSSGFPFLRYRTGDVGILDDSLCACGRGLPLIREICGRTNDCLTAVDGSVVHGSALNYILRGLKGVESYKVIQEESQLCRVLIVAGDEFSKDKISSIRDSFAEQLGCNMRIQVECVDAIQPEASGKFRHIVNLYKQSI